MEYERAQTISNRPLTSTGAAMGLADESPSPIRDGVCFAEQSLSELHSMIDVLTKRLETALAPVPPQADTNRTPQPSGPPVSHLAGRLVILNEGYQQAVGRLRELARRVEV